MMKKTVENYSYLLASLILALSYGVFRYVLFSLHGMKQWPTILMYVGFVVIFLAILFKGKWTALAAGLGYPLGILGAYLFQKDTLDPVEGMKNNFWYLWMFIMLATVIVGILADIYTKRRNNTA